MPPPHPPPDDAAGSRLAAGPRLAAALLRRRPALAAGAGLALLGLLGGLLPLLDVPGYELGLLGAWLGVALAGPLGLAAARRELDRPGGSPGVAALAAALAATVLLLPLLGASALRAAFGPCQALFGAAFFPVLAFPSAWLAAAIAAAAAWWRRGRAGPTAALLALALLASLGWTLLEAWRGPAAFALDHLLGVWPGPLYDEALALDARLLLFRAATAGLAVAAGGAASLLAGRRGPRRRAAPLLCLAAGLATFGAARLALRQRVLDGDRAAIERALGGRLDGPACTIHFPAEKPAPAAEALLADCEFHAADLAAALGLPGPPHVTVFVHRSDAEKRRHVGAGATSFTKPWLGEIHLTDAAWPHPVLRHELVHAVAAALHPCWLGVPARAGLLPSMGLVEGLAVALEAPRGGWTLHQWARAARDLGFLPDLASAMGPTGFWSAPPARAYGAAGSLLGWLLARRGPGPVAALYSGGDFQAALGAPVEAVVAEWQAFLDGVAVPDGLAAAARARYLRPAVFAVPCAREVAALEEGAWEEARAGRVAEACAGLRRVAEVTRRPGPLKQIGDLLGGRGDLDGAAEAYAAAVRATPAGDLALAAQLASVQGDLAWRRGDAAAAEEGWRRALESRPDRPEARLLLAKRIAAADPALAAAARPLLLGTEPLPAALDRLARSDHPLAAYLWARQALARGEAAAALPRLERAAAGGLPGPLDLEARFVLAEARCLGGEAPAGEVALAALAAGAEAPIDRERAELGLRRCAFERRRAARAAGAPPGR